MSAAAATREATRHVRALERTVVPASFDDRERLAAWIAHELRAPIALQRALVEVTLADPDADTAALREMGERVVAGCVRQQRLVEALLDLGRSGGGLTRLEPVDLAAVAAAAFRAHDPGELESLVALEPAETIGDPDLLERLAANLVSNAIRHNVVGGRIEVATRAESREAVLSVANTGLPITAGELQRLFHPCQRLDPGRTRHQHGHGLGLSIVRAIATAHGATVTAQPSPHGGVSIEVAFPRRAHPQYDASFTVAGG